MFTISPQWVLKQLGISDSVDPETAQMATMLVMRYQAAPDKAAFVKDAIRKALFVTLPSESAATRAPHDVPATPSSRLSRKR